jgi:predicted nucleotidyltransferase
MTGRNVLMTPPEKLMDVVNHLKEALLEAYEIEAIILFGSLGRGEADEFSDVDLLVVMETDRDTVALGKELAGYLDPVTKDKHIIVKTPKEFCREEDIPGTLAFSAAKEGHFLLKKKGWRRGQMPLCSRDKRRQEVINQEYLRSAFDFLARARSSSQRSNFYRCRDFTKFAAVKAIKGIFVKHDIHPPRGTDLIDLLNTAKELEPGLVQWADFLGKLNGYCPGPADIIESRRSGDLVERTTTFVKEVVVILEAGWSQ